MNPTRQKLDHLLSDYDHARKQVIEEKTSLKEARETREATEKAQSFVQRIAEALQQSAHAQIARVVTRCLETVFEEDSYEFRILFDRKRGRTEARMIFVRDGQEIDPVKASGGGVIDVAAFALRLACLVLSRPKKRLFLSLDEPFKYVSKNYRGRVRELLLTLAKEMGIQILMVTHSPEFVCGKVVEIS